jgi:hypothetical protein
MKKLTNNDIFYNDILTKPKYVITMQSGSLRINDQINQNQEKSSSISIIEYPRTYSYESSNKANYSGSYQYSSSINREFIYATSSMFGTIFNSNYTDYSSLKKILVLKNVFKDYVIENEYAKIDYYLLNNGLPLVQKVEPGDTINKSLDVNKYAYYIRPSSSINLITIPNFFYGSYINPGSVHLNMYVSGVLTASAVDTNKNGKLIQTYGGTTGSVVGSVFYDHGIILLTGSQQLSSQQAPYIQPLTSSNSAVNDYLKWIHFGSYIGVTGSAPETKYELTFQGTNYVPTLTMFCHAEKNELFWSNNRSFIEAGQGEELYIGQSTSSINSDGQIYYAESGSFLLPSDNTFKENPYVIIKNTISSSFAHYSASYQPQVFISQIGIYDEEKNLIGIAKLANPVRKTKELDYTFKLKLDM